MTIRTTLTVIPQRYVGYATCDQGPHQFYVEQPGQTTCRLCHESRHFGRKSKAPRTIVCEMCKRTVTAKSSSHKFCDDCQPKRQTERKSEWRDSNWRDQKDCKICNRPFWPSHQAMKICHKDECKSEGRRRAEKKYNEKRKVGAA